MTGTLPLRRVDTLNPSSNPSCNPSCNPSSNPSFAPSFAPHPRDPARTALRCGALAMSRALVVSHGAASSHAALTQWRVAAHAIAAGEQCELSLQQSVRGALASRENAAVR